MISVYSRTGGPFKPFFGLSGAFFSAWCPRFASVFDANLGQQIPTRLPGYRPKTGREPGAPGYHTDEEVVS